MKDIQGNPQGMRFKETYSYSYCFNIFLHSLFPETFLFAKSLNKPFKDHIRHCTKLNNGLIDTKKRSLHKTVK